MNQPHSNQREILAELGYKRRAVFNARQGAGIRSDGLPYANRCKVTDSQRASRTLARRIEDIALAKELGISLNELKETI